MRLGLCCIFKEAPIHFRMTTVSNYLKKQEPLPFLSGLILDNIAALHQALTFCDTHGIGAFRVVSSFLPLIDHPEYGYRLEDLPQADQILSGLASAKKNARTKKIRLTFHPDQFVVLNSPKEEVVQNGLRVLEAHALLADHLGADVINIHAGGAYGDKEAALDRFASNFSRLSPSAQKKLTVENDDKSYSPEDLLPLCHFLNIPLVYDVHHHRCVPDSLSEEEATLEALATWNREPLFHVSSPKLGGPFSQHADMLNPDDIPSCWHTIDPLTVDIEAKAKEVAIQNLF